MLDEVLEVMQPASGKTFVDATFGAGGYSKALLDAGANVLALDRDPAAIRDGQELVVQYGGRLTLVEGEFANIERIVEEQAINGIDGVVLDIGVSSMQLDEANRGFSFQMDGPLDMRMAQHGVSAADVVNQISQPDLTRILGLLGEERKASTVSRAIVAARETGEILTTGRLAGIVEKVLPRRSRDRIHPATRTFQALRMFVNQELRQLAEALFASERILKDGGRLVVVTFHSLEDRIVKLFFKSRAGAKQGSRHAPAVEDTKPVFQQLGRGLFKASDAEAAINPRSRSAKLRWGERTAESPMSPDLGLFALPDLVPVNEFQLRGV